MGMRIILVSAAIAASGMISGCGTVVPRLAEVWEGTNEYTDLSPSGLLEYNVKQKIYCGIVDAVLGGRQAGLLPTGWAVQTTLSLQVDETGALNPGVIVHRATPEGPIVYVRDRSERLVARHAGIQVGQLLGAGQA